MPGFVVVHVIGHLHQIHVPPFFLQPIFNNLSIVYELCFEYSMWLNIVQTRFVNLIPARLSTQVEAFKGNESSSIRTSCLFRTPVY